MKIAAFFLLALISTVANAQYEIGKTVKNFSLRSTDGSKVSLSSYSDRKGVIVIFDCNTCPYSKMYNDRIIALNKMYKSKGFPVITINANDPGLSPGDSFDEMVALSRQMKYDFPYLQDETQEVAKAFGATNTPHVYVLTRKNNEFVVSYIGAIDNNSRDANAATTKYVEDAVNALLEGKAVPLEKTKAIGCGIKYRKAGS
jgi:peroxiredoxin